MLRPQEAETRRLENKKLTQRLSRLSVLGLAFALAFVLSACASLPPKEKATRGLGITETILGQAQDIERQLCNPALAAQTPPPVITHCEGDLAAKVNLTDERHKSFAQALSNAFGLQIKAATALQAWRAGDPPPADLSGLQTNIQEALTVVRQLAPASPRVQDLIGRLQEIIDTIVTAINDLRGGN